MMCTNFLNTLYSKLLLNSKRKNHRFKKKEFKEVKFRGFYQFGWLVLWKYINNNFLIVILKNHSDDSNKCIACINIHIYLYVCVYL